MSLLQEVVKLVAFAVTFVPLLCGCSDRLQQWNHYQKAMKDERLFNDMHWPNEEWVVFFTAFLKFAYLLCF